MGESGSGKSSSIRTLPANETFLINVLDKPLPFKGSKSLYTKLTEEGGNYFASDDAAEIIKKIRYVNIKFPQIKNIVIDDFQYVMANEFMRRAKERGFDKFTEIAQNAWSIIKQASDCRDDIDFFFLSHTELDALGRSKCKTIGKMLDDKITVEGMFTVVLHTIIADGVYKFLTKNDGSHIAKSPMGMFEERYIDNDLLLVKQKMKDYFDEEK